MPEEKITIELSIEELKFLQMACRDYEKMQKSVAIVMGSTMVAMCGIDPHGDNTGNAIKMIESVEEKHKKMEAGNYKIAQDLASVFRNKIFDAHLQSSTAGGKA